MGDEKEYERIWCAIEKCVKQCLVDEFSCLEEMLYRYNWYRVHVNCRSIIEKHMKSLRVTDPHMFDQAVCWHTVSTGLDRDPKWRGICVFFFAAAMEIAMIEREKEKFREVKSTGGLPGQGSSQAEHGGYDIGDMLRRLMHSHNALHEKHDALTVSNTNLHKTVSQIQNQMANSNNANMVANHQVHINIPSHGWPQAAGPSPDVTYSDPGSGVEGNTQGVDMQKILELLMGYAANHSRAKSSRVDTNRFNVFGAADERGVTSVDSY